MSIDFSLDRWQRIRDDARKWWAGDLGRPLVNVTIGGRDPGRAEPDLPSHGFASFYDLSVPAEDIVDRWDYDLSCRRFVGDAFPAVWPNFGAGVAAAFLGAKLTNRTDHPTVWFEPDRPRLIGELAPTYDADNVWLNRVKDVCRAAMDRWGGQVQVAMTDLGGTLDILSSFLPSEQLPLDLYDHPDDVKRLAWQVHELWFRYFNEIDAALRPTNPGYTAWTPIYSETPYYMLQCDFCYMISPAMFDEFVKPELAATCARLDHPFYHLDGPGQLPHLDSLLSIPELSGVQWITGAGNPDQRYWPEVYRKIHAAGKRIQLSLGAGAGSAENVLDMVADQIGTAEGLTLIGAVGREHEDWLLDLLARHGVEA